jgi:hypothetical protein
VINILGDNIKNNIFAGYDAQWEELHLDTELVHKLVTKYDFAEANDATKALLKK